ncbi:hypothetical protein [Micromonospora sp. NPDC049102]|uniref:hypothetical protein n=1 Tax=Micromonospora sp. NPDC049102 TaxID=3364265 RepID=UPI0037195DAA
MSEGARPGPSGGFRPGPSPGSFAARPSPPAGPRPGPPPDPAVAADDAAGHPAVDAAVRAMDNAAALAPADQIAQYQAAYETLRETLATIDQT